MTVEWREFPAGDGKPDCPYCAGRGVEPLPANERPSLAIGEITRPCICTLKRDILVNVERGWAGLSKAHPIEKSPLYAYVNQNLWVTASLKQLRENLRHVAVRMGPTWFFRVVTDVDLMNAWLSKTLDVRDPDVDEARHEHSVSNNANNVVELVEPAKLLIIRLGVKAARNAATPEVLLEALQHRAHLDKPTWIIDQNIYLFQQGHIAFSGQIEGFIADWDHITLDRTVTGDEKQAMPGIYQMGIGQAPVVTQKANQTLDVSQPDDFKTGDEKRRFNKGRGNKR